MNIMKTKLILILVLFFGVSIPSAIAKSNYPKIDFRTLTKIKNKANFKMFVPHELPPKWTLEVKIPYPLDITKPINDIRLHYFSQDDEYMVGIQQFKETRNTILEKESVSPDYIVEKIFVNNHEGRFSPWWKTRGENGGYLSWVQDGTYITMDSFNLTKDEMMKLAKLME
ncbi:hypothetical protein QFZ80_000246 [Paenibacillus sp. V4I7]|nr:hypothetical protein [Paenibacillus sp. V4I7]MDQ0914038.1 hypothetical protein [Paenibacillus sp. V4I5]